MFFERLFKRNKKDEQRVPLREAELSVAELIAADITRIIGVHPHAFPPVSRNGIYLRPYYAPLNERPNAPAHYSPDTQTDRDKR